ncbi:hypothetical protein [Streptomyces sp. S1D4-20]|uniref:hypothetical protein n=1 Tax=Streptomyces sp. S1D4-20 TaxID=2594462 RepID=UPI0011636560|nr:hypothetical protein [Streptomyces sp. S1D4-20]QDN54013.1 hypothetical protein FNV67_00050 [Streptomyces sp. S1D4-20]
MGDRAEDEPVSGRARRLLDRLSWDKAHQVLSHPDVVRAAARVQEHELLAGAELEPRFGVFADRYRQAVATPDYEVLSRICPAKHGQWGRACVLDAGHEDATGGLHWGLTTDGRPIAWAGTAPDDD